MLGGVMWVGVVVWCGGGGGVGGMRDVVEVGVVW